MLTVTLPTQSNIIYSTTAGGIPPLHPLSRSSLFKWFFTLPFHCYSLSGNRQDPLKLHKLIHMAFSSSLQACAIGHVHQSWYLLQSGNQGVVLSRRNTVICMIGYYWTSTPNHSHIPQIIDTGRGGGVPESMLKEPVVKSTCHTNERKIAMCHSNSIPETGPKTQPYGAPNTLPSPCYIFMTIFWPVSQFARHWLLFSCHTRFDYKS